MRVVARANLVRGIHESVGNRISRFADSVAPVVYVGEKEARVSGRLECYLQPLLFDAQVRENNRDAIGAVGACP